MEPDDMPFDADAYLNARGTSMERAKAAVDAFSKLAHDGDEKAARTILAQLENKNANDPNIRKALDPNKVAIVKTAIGTIRRGTPVDLVLTALSAGLGVTLGYFSHKVIDLRVLGYPVNSVAGALGVAAGVVGGGRVFDSTLTIRNALFSGGAMFSVGSMMYARIHADDPPSDLNRHPGDLGDQ